MSIENEIALALQHNEDDRACSLMDSAQQFNPNFVINGDPLLFISAAQPHTPKSTRKLLEKNAYANTINWHGMSPLIVCADKGHNMESLSALIEYKADLDYCMRSNQNAWFYASLSAWKEGEAFLGKVMREEYSAKISSQKSIHPKTSDKSRTRV